MGVFYHELFDISEQNPVQFFLHRGTVDYVIQEHWHEALEIDYLRDDCSACVWINGRKQEASGGALVLMNSGDIHALYPDRILEAGDEQIHGASLFISFEFLRRLDPDIENTAFCLEGNPEKLGELRELFEKLIAQQESLSDGYGYLKLHAAALEILYLLFTYFRCEKNEGVVSSRKYIARLQKVMNYMEQHYSEPLTLQELAETFSVSPAYLSKVFKTYTGHTFKTCLNRIRLNHALYDVIHREATMSEIALSSGFPDTRSLNALFKEAYGLTPLQYRKEHRRSAAVSGAAVNDKPFIRMMEKDI